MKGSFSFRRVLALFLAALLCTGAGALAQDAAPQATLRPSEEPILPEEYIDVREDELSVAVGLPGDVVNILLLGTDSRGEKWGRSDTIILASVNRSTGAIKLISIMRDTILGIPGRDKATRINAAYAYGGPNLAMKTVNEVFGLNVTDYVVVDFFDFPRIIDAIGGIRLNVLEAEVPYINAEIGYQQTVSEPDMDFSVLERWGENTPITGQQALAYSRLRYLDSDYQRTQRQRNVLEAIIEKILNENNSWTLVGMVMRLLPFVKTEMDVDEVLEISNLILNADHRDIQELRLPQDGAYEDGIREGVWGIFPDFDEMNGTLHSFIYGD